MLAIIPARGGSKGLPGKNLRNLAGKPLICHTISAALKAKSINRVIVSTDDVNIASIAKGCGAEVPFMRPNELASDNSLVIDSYLYMIDHLSSEGNIKIDSFIALLPTAPLRLAFDIDGAIEVFNTKEADSVISITDAEVPVEWYKRINKNGILEDYLTNANIMKNRQEFDASYIPNGAIYIFNVDKLRSLRTYYMDKTFPYIMSRAHSVDIDEVLDFYWAEFLINKQQST